MEPSGHPRLRSPTYVCLLQTFEKQFDNYTLFNPFHLKFLTISDDIINAHIFKYTHHHHHVGPPVRISLTLSCHPSVSSIASSRSSRLHLVSVQSCCMLVLAGCLAFARPCERVHRSMSLMSSSLLLRQCPACLVRLTWIVFVMGCKWPYDAAWGGTVSRTCSILLA